jgi:Na+/H+ antiporter NhaD/arsenite permease-like protein
MKNVHKLILIFIGLVFPYLGLVIYLSANNPDWAKTAPSWVLWGIVSYFFLAMAVLSFSIRFFRKRATEKTQAFAEKPAPDGQPSRAIKRLFIIYVVLFPFNLIAVFLQKELPTKFAILALIVPGLVIVALWRSVRRNQGARPNGSTLT